VIELIIAIAPRPTSSSFIHANLYIVNDTLVELKPFCVSALPSTAEPNKQRFAHLAVYSLKLTPWLLGSD